jgi:ribonuclease HI
MPPKSVTIYSDGACLGNPGPGGYGTVLLYGAQRKELSAGFRRTTNNRMELLGAIAGLEALKQPCSVDAWSDRNTSARAHEGLADGWRTRGWRTEQGAGQEPDLCSACCARWSHTIAWHWVRGHTGDPEVVRACRRRRERARLAGGRRVRRLDRSATRTSRMARQRVREQMRLELAEEAVAVDVVAGRGRRPGTRAQNHPG